MKVYTYYQDINAKHQSRLLTLWGNSWSNNGFEAIVLTEADVKSHPFYEEFTQRLIYLNRHITDGRLLSKYGMSCWVRWLAYTTRPEEKFFVCDYDIINHNFTPIVPSDDLFLLDGDCPCVASGKPSQFLELCKKIVNITEDNLQEFISLYKELGFGHFHDQEFFTIARKLGLGNINTSRNRDAFLGTPEQGEFWKKQLVHYSHNARFLFAEKRNQAFNEEVRCEIVEEHLALGDKKTFKFEEMSEQTTTPLTFSSKPTLTNCLDDFVPVGGGVRNADLTLNETGRLVTLLGIKDLLPCINRILTTTKTQLSQIEVYSDDKKTEISEKLKELFNRHGSDKSYNHDYHLVYGEIFQRFDVTANLNILEIGLGSQTPLIPSRMSGIFSVGSSIRAFKEYFSNAQIFGADVDKDILFEEDRIKTSYVDQLNYSTFELMHSNFGRPLYDLIIEDGLHSFTASLNTLNFALKYIKPGGTIVLEDLGNKHNFWGILTSLLVARGFNAKLINSKGLMLVLHI